MSRRAKGFGLASHCDFQDSDVVICDGDLTIRNAEGSIRCSPHPMLQTRGIICISTKFVQVLIIYRVEGVFGYDDVIEKMDVPIFKCLMQSFCLFDIRSAWICGT